VEEVEVEKAAEVKARRKAISSATTALLIDEKVSDSA